MHHLTLFGWMCLCFIMLGRVSVARSYKDHQTWNLPDGAIARFGKGGISQGDRVVASSLDGKLLAVSTEIDVWLYDVNTTREPAPFLASEDPFDWGATAFSPDRTHLAVADAGGVKLWDVSQGRILRRRSIQLLFPLSISFLVCNSASAPRSNASTSPLRSLLSIISPISSPTTSAARRKMIVRSSST